MAVYVRVSTPQQRHSMTAQRLAVEKYAKDHSLEVVASYEDFGRSGVTAGGRAGLSRLLLDIVSGEAQFSTLIIMDISRWGRFQNLDEAGHYEFVCRANGVSVVYCRKLASEGPALQLEKQVRRVMAAEHSRQLSERVRQGKRRSVEAGNAPGSWPRYIVDRQVIEIDGSLGTRLSSGQFRTHPDQSLRLVQCDRERRLVIRRIFSMFATGGISMSEIAAKLNAEGILWVDGSQWTRRRIGKILRHPVVTGIQQYGRSRTVLGVRGRELDETRWGEVRIFDPIVPVDLFKVVQARFAALAGHSGYSNHELIEGLRTLLRDKGTLSARVINECEYLPSSRRYETRFGSLGAAFSLVGYSSPAVSRGADADGRPMGREAVLVGLRLLHSEQGKVTQKLVAADRRLPSAALISRMFGSLSAAYRAAGIS